jgi:hypothetical protein
VIAAVRESFKTWPEAAAGPPRALGNSAHLPAIGSQQGNEFVTLPDGGVTNNDALDLVVTRSTHQ